MLNLLPWREEKQKKIKKVLWMGLVITIMLSAIATHCVRKSCEEKTEKLKQSNEILKTKLQACRISNENFSKELIKYRRPLIKEKLKNRQIEVSRLLTLVTAAFPENGKAEYVLFTDKGLVVNGVLNNANQESLNNFVKKLQINYKKNIAIIKNIKHEETVCFTIGFSLKGTT